MKGCESLSKVLVADSREKKNFEVLKYLEITKVPFVVRKVEAGDYIWCVNGIDDYRTIIDLKKDLVEVYNNIAGSKKEHERFKRELARARELGCERFVVLVREPLANLEAVQTWESPTLKGGKKIVKKPPMTLYKTMKTFETKYGVEWQFTDRYKAGKVILEILGR